VKRRQPLFNAHWTTVSGERIGRVTREEMRELHRLWAKHRDLRERDPFPSQALEESER
jgi:hypothetical protein